MKVLGFDWYEGNHAECQKHGVSIGEIEGALRSSPRATPDVANSADEDRFIAIGRTSASRALFLAFTFRLEGRNRLIRLVSARYRHKKESDAYDKSGS